MPDLRLVGPAIAAWVGAWLIVAAPEAGISPWTVVIAVWAVAVAAVAVIVVLRAHATRLARAVPRVAAPKHPLHTAMQWCAAVLVALAATGLVVTSAGAALEARSRSSLAEAASSGSTVGVVVELTSAPRAMSTPWFDGGADGAASGLPQRVEGRVVAVDGVHVVSVPVTATVDVAPSELQLGTTLSFDANAASLPSAEAAAFRLRVSGDVHAQAPPFWLAWSGALRTNFADAAESLGGDGGALVPGLAIGDTSAVGDELDDAMKASSLSHLTAVSGANCAIVTAAAFALAAACRAAASRPRGGRAARARRVHRARDARVECGAGRRDGGRRADRARVGPTGRWRRRARGGRHRAARRRSVVLARLRFRALGVRDRGIAPARRPAAARDGTGDADAARDRARRCRSRRSSPASPCSSCSTPRSRCTACPRTCLPPRRRPSARSPA